MLAKITSKNQLTLPKRLMQVVGATQAEYFDIEARGGQLILTPVRIQRGDAVRAKLAELDLTEDDVTSAVAWARQTTFAPVVAHESVAVYDVTPTKPKKARAKKALPKA